MLNCKSGKQLIVKMLNLLSKMLNYEAYGGIHNCICGWPNLFTLYLVYIALCNNLIADQGLCNNLLK
jgi:hypothetical protein